MRVRVCFIRLSRVIISTVRSGYKKLLIKKPRLVRNPDEKTGFFLVRDKKPRSIRKFLNFL